METVVLGARLPSSLERASKRSYRLGSGVHVFGRADLIASLQLGLKSCDSNGPATQRQTHPVDHVDGHAKRAQNPASKMPTEVWLLVLAWSGLRTSARAAACCSTFRDLHRTVASTPTLLSRALLADHGPGGAAAHLYGNTSGQPHLRHTVRSDDGIASAIHELLLLSDPSGSAAAFAAATAASFLAPCTAWGSKSQLITRIGLSRVAPARLASSFHFDASPATPVDTTPRAPSRHLGGGLLSCPWAAATTATTSCSIATPVPTRTTGAGPTATGGSPAGWDNYSGVCLSPVVTPHAGTLLRAAAAAGHVRVAAAAMGMGARVLDGALVGASGCGRARVVQLLLASGADPDASEPFGPCALFEAARNGYTEVAELLLDAGARVDGAADLPTGYGNTLPAAPAVGGALTGGGLPRLLDLRTFPAPLHDGVGSITPVGSELRARVTSTTTAVPAATTPTAAPLAVAGNSIGASTAAGVVDSSAPALAAAPRAAAAANTHATTRAMGVNGGADFHANEAPCGNVQVLGGAGRKRRRSGDLGESRTYTVALDIAVTTEPRTPTDAAGRDVDTGVPFGDANGARATSNGASGSGGGGIDGRIRPMAACLPPPLRRRRPVLPGLLPALPLLPQLPPLHTPPPLGPQLARLPSGSPLMLIWPSYCQCATPLLAACRAGHASVAALLLHRGARVDLTRGSELLLAGSRGVVDKLLAAAPGLAAHLNAALVSAASGNRPEVVAALLEQGADPVVSGGMALNEATFQGHVAVVAALLAAGGARLRGSGALLAAHRLAQRWGRTDVARMLAEML